MPSPEVRLVSSGGSEAIVLVGTPRHLKGKLRLVNDGAAPVTVTAAEVTAHVPPAAAKGARGPVLEHWAPRVVPAGEATKVSVSVALDPLTPPGSYQATLVVDGRPQ